MKNISANPKRFLYLVQSRKEYPYFHDLVSRNSDAIVLYWRSESDQPVMEFIGQHVAWQGPVYFFPNGRMERTGGDKGSYEIKEEREVVLHWDDWPAEKLEWDQTEQVYRSCEKDFVLRETALLTPDSQPSWKEIHFPNSTWNTGRNRLLQEALTMEDYQYYIFMDDDIQLEADDLHTTAEGFRKFEQFLLATQPAVGFCNYDWHVLPNHEPPVALRSYDACFNALHHDTLPVLLPYYEGFDKQSWWWSQVILYSLAAIVYRGSSVQLNSLRCRNFLSEPYPRGNENQLGTPCEFLLGSVLEPAIKSDFDDFPQNMHRQFPVATNREYRQTLETLSQQFNLQHPYWTEKIAWWESTTGKWLS